MAWEPQERLQGFGTRRRPSLVEDFTPKLLYLAWRGVRGDQGIYYSSYSTFTNWARQERIPDAVSRGGPSVAMYPYDVRLYGVWRGIGYEGGTGGGPEDQGIYFSSYGYGPGENTKKWTQPPVYIQNHASFIGPSLAFHRAAGANEGRSYMAWRGTSDSRNDDQGIYYSSYGRDPNDNTLKWTQPLGIPGRGSLYSPSLCSHEGRLYMAWRGINRGGNDDQGIYYSVFNDNTNTWEGQQNIPGIGSFNAPSLGLHYSTLYMAWRGINRGGNDDQGIYYSFFNDNTKQWEGQQNIPGIGSFDGPSLARYQATLHMAWRGVRWGGNDDQGIYISFKR